MEKELLASRAHARAARTLLSDEERERERERDGSEIRGRAASLHARHTRTLAHASREEVDYYATSVR
jgi:hypothetical protein